MKTKTLYVPVIGFGNLLVLLFITLKLTGVISWNWLWVLAPLWMPFALVALFLGAFGLLFALFFVATVILALKQ